MKSKISRYTVNIDTAFPVAGQDNDPQGFRDNFSNIKFALTQASIEINTASQNLNPIIHTDLIIDPPTKSLNINSATIALSQTLNGTPILNISGVHDISLNNEKLAASISLGNISLQYPEIGQMALSPTGSYIATGSTGTVSLGTGTWTKLNSGIESNRLIVVKPTASVSAISPIPNVTCDVSMGTRFYIPNPGTNIALNFINLPPSPFEVEVYVTVKLAPNTYSAIEGIFINGGAIQTTMTDNPGRFVDGGGGGLTYSLDSPGWGFKQKITIMSTEKDQYSIFSTEDIFLSPRSVYSSQLTQDQLTSYVPPAGGYVPPLANNIPGQQALTINGVGDGGTLNLPIAYGGVPYSYTFTIGGTQFNPNINYAITSVGSIISGLSLAIGKNSATLQGAAGLTLVTSNFDIIVSPKYNPTGISCRVHVSLPNANAQTQSTRVVEDVIASAPTPPPTPYTPEPPQKPFVQASAVAVSKLDPKPAQPVVTNNVTPPVAPSQATIKPGDPVPGQPGLVYTGVSSIGTDKNGNVGLIPQTATIEQMRPISIEEGNARLAAALAIVAPSQKVVDVKLEAINTYGAPLPGSTPYDDGTYGSQYLNYNTTNAVKIQATIKTADGRTRIQTLDSIDAGGSSTVVGDGLPGLDGKVIDYRYSSTAAPGGGVYLQNGGNLTYTVRDNTTQPTVNTVPLNNISAPTTVAVNDNTSVSVNAGSSYAGATLNLITTTPDNTKTTQPVVADSSGNINITGIPTSQPGNVNVTVVADNSNQVSANIGVGYRSQQQIIHQQYLDSLTTPSTSGDGGGSGDVSGGGGSAGN